MNNPLFGGIEAGGTKFICAVGNGPEDIRADVSIPTTTPAETIDRALAFFRKETAVHGPLKAIGIAAFGPLNPDPGSPTWGTITTTPKPGWANTPLGNAVREALGVPVGFDSDVNGAALGEHRWGAGQGCDPLVYLTVGTGIGGGGLINGELMHGLIHPEMGHISIPHHWDKDPYPGSCPYHGDCLEGLAAGPALEGRWGKPGNELPAEHPAWDLEAFYLAEAVATIISILSPHRIIIGGGVLEQSTLLPKIRRLVGAKLNGYVRHPSILDSIDDYIVAPGLGNKAGVLGAFALAELALESPAHL